MIKAGHAGDPLGCDVEGTEETIYSTIWEWMVRAAMEDSTSKEQTKL